MKRFSELASFYMLKDYKVVIDHVSYALSTHDDIYRLIIEKPQQIKIEAMYIEFENYDRILNSSAIRCGQYHNETYAQPDFGTIRALLEKFSD